VAIGLSGVREPVHTNPTLRVAGAGRVQGMRWGCRPAPRTTLGAAETAGGAIVWGVARLDAWLRKGLSVCSPLA